MNQFPPTHPILFGDWHSAINDIASAGLSQKQQKWLAHKMGELKDLTEKGEILTVIEKMEHILIQLEYVQRHPGLKPKSDAIELHYRERHDLETDFLPSADASLLEFQTDLEQENQSSDDDVHDTFDAHNSKLQLPLPQ